VDHVVSRHKIVLDLFLGVDDVSAPVLKVLIQELGYSWHIADSHRAQSRDLGLCGQFLEFKVASHWGSWWQGAESDLNKFLGVKTSVPVCRVCNWSGDGNTSCVDGLPNIVQVDAASDLLDKDRCQTFGSQVFMYAEEVDLSHLEDLLVETHMHRDT